MFVLAQQAVKEFHQAFHLPVATSPTHLEKIRVELRAKWIQEEVVEFLRATSIVDQVDAVTDLIYFAIGVFVEMGVDGSKIFELVHQANMSKIGRHNKALYNFEGKVIKPDGWISPEENIRKYLDSVMVAPE